MHDPYAYVEEPGEETNAVYSDADEYGMEEVGGQNGVGDNSGRMPGRGGASSRARPLNGGPFDDQGFPQVKLVLVDPFRTTDDTEAFAR